MIYKNIEIEQLPGVVTLWLNRPEKRNALDGSFITELNVGIQSINKLTDDVIVVLRGRGDAFCSGGDLNWMQASFNLDFNDNYNECLQLTQCLYNLYSCDKVTIAVIHGAAYGGGIGLAATCDMAICTDDASFSLSELRMGIVASAIGPYIMKRLGESRSKELVFTGKVFNGKQAETYGLVNRSVSTREIETVLNEYVSLIHKGSANACKLAKNLMHQLSPLQITQDVMEKTARLLAEVRVSNDAQHRMKEFLTKVSQ